MNNTTTIAATDIEQIKQKLLSRIKPEFQRFYIADLEYFNGSYKDRVDVLRKAEELGHLE